MLTWLAQNIATILVAALLVLMCWAIVRSMARDKKKGKSLCGGNCSACGGGCACNSCSAHTKPQNN